MKFFFFLVVFSLSIAAFGDSTDNQIVDPPLAPTDFIGVVKKCKFLNSTKIMLKATFVPVSLSNVVEYVAYENGHPVATIPKTGPFVFEACLHSSNEAEDFTIEAVYPDNIFSPFINIRIVHE
jgi:hypothetical protein